MARLLAAFSGALALLVFCAPVHAHLRWLEPSHTVLSEEAPVTFDASVSNDVFHPERPFSLHGVTVVDPNGREQKAVNQLEGKRRSVFDVVVDQPGTWRVALESTGYFVRYTDKQGERQGWRGDRKGLEAALKKARRNADGPVSAMESHSVLENFVTLGAPSKLASVGEADQGLTFVYGTHPNDLYAGETLELTVLVNGKPASGVELTLVKGGTRYRDEFGEQSFTTDEQGQVSIAWQEPGMYLLMAEQDGDSAIEGLKRRDTRLVTLEVLPQ